MIGNQESVKLAVTGATGVWSLATGDMDGDGWQDLLIGRSLGNNRGELCVVSGKALLRGPVDLATAGSRQVVHIRGESGLHNLGVASAVTDVNGDGRVDIVTAASNLGNGDRGYAYVLFTPLADLAALDGINGFRISGDLGLRPVASGDINGDGYGDVLVRDYGESSILFGRGSGFPASASITDLGNSVATDLGVAGSHIVGDINGDGFEDMVISAGFDRSIYVVFGTEAPPSADWDPSQLDPGEGFQIDPYIEAINSVSGAGDVNGDGFDDIVIGAWSESMEGDPGYYYSDTYGAVYVVFGKPDSKEVTLRSSDFDSIGESRGFVIGGAHSFDDIPTALSAGDFNGDGHDDIIIKVGSSIRIALLGAAERGSINFHDSATKLAPAGDVNGDGFDDVVVAKSDTVYIIYGYEALTPIDSVGTINDDRIAGTPNANILIGGRGADTINGGDGEDVEKGAYGRDFLTGGKGGDRLEGDRGNDLVQGGSGADRVFGDEGKDTLEGGLGMDTLIGGIGWDVFRFHTLDAPDRIVDFGGAGAIEMDLIALDPTIFTALRAGALAPAKFVAADASPTAADPNDRILYDRSTGELFYDADGSGPDAAIKFAVLATAPSQLSAADFIVA